MQLEDFDEENATTLRHGATYRVFDKKFRELDQPAYCENMHGLAVVSYNHDDDTFDVIKPLYATHQSEDENA
jgi:hypothetical protein